MLLDIRRPAVPSLAGHRKSELGASRVLFPWNVRTGFAFHRLHTPGMRPLHPERSTEKILRGSPIPLFRWPASGGHSVLSVAIQSAYR